MAFLPDIWRSRSRDLWNPMREMSQLQRRIDRLFDDFLMEPTYFEGREEFDIAPAFDVEETDKQYVLNIDIPGVKKQDLKIDLQDRQLTISGERKEETKGRRRHERFYGNFMRSFTLPSNVDSNKIEANYQDGVLQVSLPKTAVSKGKQIPIGEGKQIESKAEKVA